jgi:hypothetical protein
MSSAPDEDEEFDLMVTRLDNSQAMMADVVQREAVWELVFNLLRTQVECVRFMKTLATTATATAYVDRLAAALRLSLSELERALALHATDDTASAGDETPS